ncbi:hypothetical protein OG453_08795 [Streptomyces sp. NBC_01381]|uniref:hypothetical protein n=1 Tax=Streptomyces sp. NBC_01381 TaxID=2903845 RepID=UPI002255CD4E|nr:hypothetical protein [Streptomyces sp. NBC_01381]MCX4666767.1 hypothetical protein [Streptomyces sp. NBC_01381]
MLSRLLARLLPGTGVRRRARVTRPEPQPPKPGKPNPRPSPRNLPRSPYAREVTEGQPIDVSGTPLTRPYYRAAEHRLLQAERRLALALALEGVDYGPAVIHGIALPVSLA